MSVGAAGPDVKTVQQALLTAGVSVPGGADGQFGPATRNAVLTFQSREGLPQTGEIDAPTAAALGLTKPAAAQPTITPGGAVLQQGDSGDAVKELQQRLTAMGVYVPGGADGDFGPGTKTAVTNFQRWNGLPQTGVVDAPTASKLGLTGSSSAPATPPATTPPAATPPAPTPPAAAANPYVGLSVGASGTHVKDLQKALIAAGVTVRGGADGIFGSATKTALQAYQASKGHSQTGTVSAEDIADLQLGTAPAPTPTPAPAPEPTPGANPYVGLRVGARGALVKDLQTALIAAGINVRGGADGVFGLATKSALVAYQSANGLGVSGEVFEATATKLGLGTTSPAPDPTPAPGPTPVPDAVAAYVGMKVGASGQLVKELQTALIGLGLVVRGGADGVFGGATKSALISFQGVNGITPTGVLTAKGAGILGLGQPATPPAATPPAPNGIVNTPSGFPVKGESSERVRVLQQKLISANINLVGGADGSFGNATAAALRDYQEQHGLTVSGTVTQETADKLGLSPSDSSTPAGPTAVTMQRFPLQGKCYFGNTWHAPRGNNRLHEGVDIIAGEGNLLYAVVDGTITKQYWDFPGATAGNGLRVAQDDGTYFTYLHMLGFAEGLEVGTKVKAGDVIGFVGNTGSSATAHLHFEIHPGGGAAVNPYPYVKAMDDCKNTTPQYQSSFAPGG